MESLVAKLGRLTEQLADKGFFSKYVEASKNCKSLESKLAAAESVLRTLKESAPVVKKNNGRVDNGRVELLTESAEQITEEAGKLDPYRGLGFSESELRRLNGLPPAGTTLSAGQLREFRFLRSINLSEADSIRGALKVV